MKLDLNDPRLTAYALGDDSLAETDRAEIAALVAIDAEAQQFVAATQAFAAEVARELAAEPVLQNE
ncbi:MAG TPA: hypothetical protein VNC50_12465, partial [Planctomycetia bacterium]|nr:hypothetical protein [Planctomycetia bacterium]